MPARFRPVIEDKPQRVVCEAVLQLITTDAPPSDLEHIHADFTAMFKQMCDYMQSQMYMLHPSQETFLVKVTKYDDYRAHDSYLP